MTQEELNEILPRDKQIELMVTAAERFDQMIERTQAMIDDPNTKWETIPLKEFYTRK
jgi:hypothetical protein